MIQALVEFLVQVIFEVISYYTGKWFLPVVSGGRLRAEEKGNWNSSNKSFVRLPSGQVSVETNIVSLFGLLIWAVIFALGIWAYWG